MCVVHRRLAVNMRARLTLALLPPHPCIALVGMLIKTTASNAAQYSVLSIVCSLQTADEQRTHRPAHTGALRQGLHSSLLPRLPRLHALCVNGGAAASVPVLLHGLPQRHDACHLTL
jgi:hypothetical protein